MTREEFVLKAAKKMASFIHKNAPMILSVCASVGVVATGYLAAKASKKEDPTWKDYIVAGAVGAATIGCIFTSAILSKKHQVELASAYALVNSAYSDYRNKVCELDGPEKDFEIIDAIAKDKFSDKVDLTPCDWQGITSWNFAEESNLDFGDNEETHLFYDKYSERFFESTFSRIIQAEYHLNRNFALRGDCPLNEFYEFLGIPGIDAGEAVGWAVIDELYWIDFNHRESKLDDGTPFFIIEMGFDPVTWEELNNL